MVTRSAAGKVIGGLLATVGWLGVMAGPAGADPAVPGDVRSEVTAISPPVPGVAAAVVGGDSFLRIEVARGTEVVVLGYEDEPYLRITADGTVEVNDRSPARWLNETRLGGGLVPAEADPGAAPTWRRIGGGGATAWHDHRSHWMATTRPEPPERDWTVPILVDGRPASIDGHYGYVSPPAAWPWWLLALGVGGGTLWIARSRGAVRTGAAAVLPGAVLTLVVGTELLRLPVAGGGLLEVLLATLSLLAAAAAWVRPRAGFAGPLLAGAGVALLVAAARRLDVLDHAVLVTDLPVWLDRLSVAMALGAGAGALCLGVRAVLQPVQGDGAYQPPGTSASASGGPHEPRT